MTSFRVECDAKEGLSAGSPEVSVRGPGGQEAEYTVDQEDDGSWSVSYLPIEVGLYTIRLLMNGADVAGSPYRVRVGEGQQVSRIRISFELPYRIGVLNIELYYPTSVRTHISHCITTSHV